MTKKPHKQIASTKFTVTILVLAAAGLLVLAVMTFWSQSIDRANPTSQGEAAIGGAFSLVNKEGKAVTERTYSGKHMLVFFGFTHCMSVCPLALTNLTEAFDKLSDEEMAKIQPLFITVDPERDTPDQMKSYLENFDPAFDGLTGSKQQVDAAVSAYRVFSSKKETANTDYQMDHSSFIYLMDGNGKYVAHFASDIKTDELVGKLKGYLK